MDDADARGPRPSVLVVDDEKLVRELTAEVLRRAGYRVSVCDKGEDSLAQVLREHPEVVICDLKMPGMDGLQVLGRCRAEAPDVEVLIVTAHGDISTAVEAMRRGAFDFITKPFSNDDLVLRVGRAVEHRALVQEASELRCRLRAHEEDRILVGNERCIVELRERIRLVAQSSANVLVSGETGTGKELVARALHQGSGRRDRAFVGVNCAALPETLIASELFGHERGAFTSAVRTHIGRFEAANGGTLFLDEIGDLAPSTQGALLRVLEEKRFERVGSSRSQAVDVRVIAATKHELGEAVRAGRFREDLFFRLAVAHVTCPPLRLHLGDIPILVEHVLQRCRRREPGRKIRLSRTGMSKLLVYSWPGNVRELENVLERAAIVSRGPEIQPEDLEFEFGVDSGGDGEGLTLASVERAHLQRVLGLCRWNRSIASRRLGIDRGTLQRKIERYGLTEKAR